jgi:hypothetical protein
MSRTENWTRLDASRTETRNENLTVGLILSLTVMIVSIVANC